MNNATAGIVGIVAGFIIGVVGVVAYQLAGRTVFLLSRAQVTQTANEVAEKTQEAVGTAADVVTAEWKVPLGEQNDSGLAGFATLNDKDGQVQVLIALASAPGATPAAHPAHIHVGACPKPGAIKFPLMDVVDGTSTTIISTTIADLKASLPLAINVHQSASQIGKYIACGDLG